MKTIDIEFDSDGTTVRGDLYLPDGDGPFPAVVMAGGWCYVKELRQPQYAQAFVDVGLAALIFDYRNLGASDGFPRQHLDPWMQIEDYKNAITHLCARDDVDAERIGAWGISYSGGHVIILSAVDRRVKCAVANVPVIDGFENMWRVHGTERFRMLRDTIDEDRRKRATTGEHGYIGMSGDPADGLTTWPFEEVRSVFVELKETQAPRHEHRNTIASIDLLMQYDALPYASRVTNTPFLMITAQDDDITLEDLELEAFDAIRTPEKKLFPLTQTTHMTLYSDLSRLDVAAGVAADWYVEHLVADGSPAARLSRSRGA